MDQRVQKLGRILRDNSTAQALVESGFDTPRKIKKATDSALRKVRGVGAATLASIRTRCPKIK